MSDYAKDVLVDANWLFATHGVSSDHTIVLYGDRNGVPVETGP